MSPSALIRRPLTVCAIGALAVGAGACGESDRRAATAVSTPASHTRAIAAAGSSRLDRDNDSDSSGRRRYDADDRPVFRFGRAASAADRGRIAALVRRYYAAAAAEDGAKACAMLYSTFAEAVPEEYGTSPPGPPYARGTTCPAVMTLVFRHFHVRLAAGMARLSVSRVLVRERQGLAVLSFGPSSEREIRVSREGRSWRIASLLDSNLP